MRSERERKHARERVLAHAQNDQVAQSPRPEREGLAAYMRERGVVRARAPVISEEIVRLQAQFASKRTTPSRA